MSRCSVKKCSVKTKLRMQCKKLNSVCSVKKLSSIGIYQMNTFYKQVYEIVEQIPYGMVISYGQIARILGRPRGAQMVGWAMRVCPENLPWQRVVMKDGSVTGGVYAGMRKQLLVEEGVSFLPDGRVNMEICEMKI
jgi:methylated-DNA-protein-cysteine methyltransferase-like protein